MLINRIPIDLDNNLENLKITPLEAAILNASELNDLLSIGHLPKCITGSISRAARRKFVGEVHNVEVM